MGNCYIAKYTRSVLIWVEDEADERKLDDFVCSNIDEVTDALDSYGGGGTWEYECLDYETSQGWVSKTDCDFVVE